MQDKYEILKLERYKRFVYTLNQCGKFVIKLSDERIETCIFEDFDIGIRLDISDENIELFLDEGWIDEEIKIRCLRYLFRCYSLADVFQVYAGNLDYSEMPIRQCLARGL